MTQVTRRLLLAGSGALALALAAAPASAQKKYDDGATDTEIKIGHTNPYSGNASAYGVIGKTIEAFFKKVNDDGGINGRKINFITYDDGYAPPKTVEMVRKLVEEDKVLFLFNTLGTPPNTAIHKYMNQKKVPQLFVATGASKWGNPKEFPWTMGWQPDYATEGAIYAKHILATVKDAKIGVLMQNDDYGKDYFNGFKAGLGKDADKIVQVATYEVTDPTIDSQMIQLKSSGANVFFNITIAQIRRPGDQEGGRDRLEARRTISTTCRPRSVRSSSRPASMPRRASSLRSIARTRPIHSGPARRTSLRGRHSWRNTCRKATRRRWPQLRLRGRQHRRGSAQEVRRQPHARERHEAGGQPQGL